MTFTWYNIFNYQEFLDTGLVSRTVTTVLENIGEKDILITKGNEVSIVYEDVLLPINFRGDNPFILEGTDAHYAVYLDSLGFVWLGIEVEA